MKCGISTACFYPMPLEVSIDKIAALGFDMVEVFINTESEFQSEYMNELHKQLDANGIRVISVHPYTSPMEGQLLFSEYDRRTEDGLLQYRRYYQAACVLGAKYLTFHGERSVIQDRDASDLQRKFSVYRQLVEIAQEYGLLLAQENVAWCKSENPEYLRLLRDNVPGLGFTLDIKQGHRAGRHWSEYLKVMDHQLVNVHINDFDVSHSCMLPGEGVMDYKAFFEKLEYVGYKGQALIEVYSSDYEDDSQISQAKTCLCGFMN